MRLTLFSLLFLSSVLNAIEGSYQYRQHCAACHGERGERQAWNVTRPIAGWGVEAVKEALQGYQKNSRDRYGYGAYMHPQISKYTPQEIDAIAQHITSLGKMQPRLASRSR